MEYISSFPNDIAQVIEKHAKNPSASSYSDVKLLGILLKYNEEQSTHLYELEDQASFSLPNGRVFKKIQQRRSRVLCQALDNKKKYLIHMMAEGELAESESL